MSRMHRQRRQRGPSGSPAQSSLGALTSFSLVLGARSTDHRVPPAGLRPLPVPVPTYTPVHSADCGGELGLQLKDKGLHQPVDAGFLRGLEAKAEL